MNIQRIQNFCWPLRRCRPVRADEVMPVYDQLLDRARNAIRQNDLDLAEAFVMENGDALWRDAPCLNLLGLIHEARGQWARAKRFWSRSARLDKRYQPARQNLRRYFELFQFGHSRLNVAFGDEIQFRLQEAGR